MKNILLINPSTKTHVFGEIPEMTGKKHYFERGEIKLRHGKHRGINKGFGAEHIWIQHEKELIALGYHSIEDVPKFVSEIIRPRMPIHCAFDDPRGNHRITIIKSTVGVAILGRETDENNGIFYSVITAFKGRHAHGTQIGSVCI